MDRIKYVFKYNWELNKSMLVISKLKRLEIEKL